MTDIVKLTNDVSYLYESGLIYGNDSFECPVCHKSYKREKPALTHLEKQDCYTIQDLFSDTEYETNAFVFFRSILSKENPSARLNISTFRKSKSYGPVVRFILFCYYHDVVDKGLYYSWLNEIVGLKFINKILSEGLKETRLREYRIFLIQNDSLIDSESFVEKYGDDLVEDQKFFVRSIEKAHVSVRYLCNSPSFPFDEVCAKLYQDYFDRIMIVIEKANL